MTTPPIVVALAKSVKAAGGRAFLVGGGVRDALLGVEPKDFDIEIFGLDVDALITVLRRFGRVDEVGRSFGVLKLTAGNEELDVSIPRRDSNSGPGHKGIAVEGDPHMSVAEACRRRDLTINAIMLDPLTQERLDPYDGVSDLQARRLRAVDETTFLEDPLRALRAVQFAARLDFEPDAALVALCTAASLDELPAERILGEWEKLLVKGVRPSRGLKLARDAKILARVFPGLVDDPSLDHALDRLAKWPHRETSNGWKLTAGLLVWLHATPDATAVLDVLNVQRRAGYPLRKSIEKAKAASHMPIETDADLRHLSAKSEVLLMLALHHALGAKDVPLTRAAELGVLRSAPERLLTGRQLGELGVKPGPEMGQLLAQIYRLQLDGEIRTVDEALTVAKRLVH